VAGIIAGFARLGWELSLLPANLLLLHGPLMVSGFFGTLISLERAVALGARWAYGGPFFGALGGTSLVVAAPVEVGALLLGIAALIFTVVSVAIVRRQFAIFTVTLLLGAVSWFIGNLIWLLGAPFLYILPWWIGFLVLTIAGERLELSRLLPPSQRAREAFIIIIVVFLTGTVASMVVTAAVSVIAVALVALALWLACCDIARHTIKGKGLTRFIAACLFTGYFWLAIGGLIGLAASGSLLNSSLAYDAILHAVFLGFVFSMVFGHAPIIFPAVTGFTVRYHSIFYTHLILLHFSLVLRLSGDLSGIVEWRTAGGLLNGLALALFMLNTLMGIIRDRRLQAKAAIA
jgi:hypothetical protein